MHIVFTIANNSSVPYFNWFAEMAYQKKGHQFSFIALCKEKPKMITDVAQFGWKCYWIPFDDGKRKTGMISAFFSLFRLLKQLKPDVVHSHLFDDAVPALFAAKLAGVKKRIILKADTGFHYNYTPQWVKFDKLNNFLATHIVAPSNESKKFILEKERAKVNKVKMIHHGIPSKIFTNKSELIQNNLIEKYQLENKIVMGTVSRLIDWKGYKYIIKAAKIVVNKYPNAVFLFIGVGDQKKELEELVKFNNLDNHIIFTGWVNRNEIPSLYGIMDIYVHAASFEPFGFVIPEAMVNDKPIVSTPTGSALDAIEHKIDGYLCAYKDEKSLAEGILYTIKNGDSFKEKVRAKGLKMFEFEVMYNNYINLYNQN